ncbi:hypothetical protein YC2023_097526 [Brassica napus]
MGLGTIRPPQELQAPQPRIDFGGHLTGPNVIGVIDGKFEDGYLVTVTMGTKQLRGVLYELLPQQSHCSFPNTNANPQVVTTTKRRRRRKKSEIKRRDPAHPKPNRSGYNFFFSDQHARLKPLNPGKDREISRMIGELWNKLNEQERLVYQWKAMEDKERYRIEMEEYREKLRTGQLMISNAVPLQQMLPPEVNLDMAAEADLVIEEDEEGDSSDCSGESEPRDDDRELEETSLNRLGLNLNSNRTAIVVGDVVMETCPSKKHEETSVVVAAEQKVSRLLFIYSHHEKKKTEEATKAILLSKVKNTNRRVLDDKEVNRRVVGAIEGKSKGSLVDLLIYARYKVVFLAN